MRPIPGFPGYAIGPQGLVYSTRRKEIVVLVPRVHKDGYRFVNITDESGKMRTCSIHRLVAKAYLRPPEGDLQVNHMNGAKHNNRVENLEWSTAKANVQHAYDTGLAKGRKGEKHHNVKLTDTQVSEIRELAPRHTRTSLARDYNVSVALISLIVNNKIRAEK